MKKFNWTFLRDKSVIVFMVAIVLLVLAGFDFYARNYLYDTEVKQPEVIKVQEMHASSIDNQQELRQLFISLGVMGFVVMIYGYQVLFSLRKEEVVVDYNLYKS